MNELLFFVIVSLFAQVAYYIFAYYTFVKKGVWLGLTIQTEGLAFGWAFGFAVEAYFWLGYTMIIIGLLLSGYVIFEKKFLPEKINKIIYYPKLQNPYKL